ncbi:MAG: response regulator transcription factor [Deltaproteobacteria bacterium]|nr:response regulator transcription factor [Deltaproteobacteria bacterium]
MNVRILVADDHNIIREGLISLLEKQPDMEVVGEAGDGRTTVRLARELLPDAIIMDVTMPDLNGIEATRQIMKDLPMVKVIALSVHSDKHIVKGMLQAGASAYLSKYSASQELIKAVRLVMADKIYLSPEIAGIVVEDYKSSGSDSTSVFTVLTAREREVLQLFAEGKNSRQIAAALYISLKTVEAHRRQIMNKMGFKSLAELIKYALREGLTSLNP